MKPIPFRKFCEKIDGKWVQTIDEPEENKIARQARNERKKLRSKFTTSPKDPNPKTPKQLRKAQAKARRTEAA